MRRYAQHYLTNRHAVDRIVAALNLTKEDAILEIGPGKGVLTGQLVTHAGRVTAVEVDDPLIPFLTRKFSGYSNFHLVHQDILDFDLREMGDVKIIGNLPYNLTSPILRKVCDASNWSMAIFMVQKEVGDRLAAKPGTSEYGAITIGVGLFAEVEKIFELSEKSFDPAPRVKSTVVRLTRRLQPLSNRPKAVQKVVQAAFQQRRKMILNALSHGLGQSKEWTQKLLIELNLDPQSRAEDLPLEAYMALADHLEAP